MRIRNIAIIGTFCVIGALGAFGNAPVGVGPEPSLASGPPTLADVETNWRDSCARTSSATVLCWGANFEGELGNGTLDQSTFLVPVCSNLCPVLLTDVTSIAVGQVHACALLSNGTVRCWGSNLFGQLGDGTNTNRITPSQVCASPPLSCGGVLGGVSAIAAGDFHTCALMNTGQVKCWGGNGFAQLGDGTNVHRNRPVDVCATGATAPCASFLTGATALSGGFVHTCAVVSGGAVKCWGDNSYGQLGDGTDDGETPGFSYHSTPVDVCAAGGGCTPITGIAQISLGGSHTCARTASAGAMCWGSDEFGQLGAATSETCAFSTPCATRPTDVSGLTSGVSQVDAAWQHSCAVTSGQGRCWGRNTQRQLGDGTTTDRSLPVSVCASGSGAGCPPLTDIIELAAGGEHSCARLSAGWNVRCWGGNQWGQLGDGQVCAPTCPRPARASPDTDGDALLDSWETTGDLNSDGIVELDLPAMGASLKVKDVFVEADWMDCAAGAISACSTPHSDKPSNPPAGSGLRYPLEEVMVAFACNPAGPIKLHVDLGPGSIMDPTVNCSTKRLAGAGEWAYTGPAAGRGGAVPHQDELGTSEDDWGDALLSVKAANFDAAVRGRVFHYMLFAHRLPFFASYDRRPTGVSPLTGDTFVVALGARAYPIPGSMTERWQNESATFMHELGHNLGLDHGGPLFASGSGTNHKPNYLSVMNYSLGVGLLSSDGTLHHFDYSRSALLDMYELSGLNEGAALEPDTDVVGYGTIWPCENGGGVVSGDLAFGVAMRAVSNVDFDCDGVEDGSAALGSCVDNMDNGGSDGADQDDPDCTTTETSPFTDVTGDGMYTPLTGAEDWSQLVFGGQAVGPAGLAAPSGWFHADVPEDIELAVAAALPDADGDDLLDRAEPANGTGVNNPDSDADGLLDGREVGFFSTAPLDPDSDDDGIPDGYDAQSGCLDPHVNDAASDPDSDSLSSLEEYGLSTDACRADTDRDGCGDGAEAETASGSQVSGGRRDPLSFWDFYDTPNSTGVRDKFISIGDILRVANRFGASDAGGTAPVNRYSNPLNVPPPAPPAYHPAFDRGAVIGPNNWNRAPANGAININDDILGVANQFGHSCL